MIRHPEIPTNPFFVDPTVCYALLDEMLEFCAEFGEDHPNLCDELSIRALVAGCLAPYR